MAIININVGLLGHVDSGKTSLAKALTTVKSTACFDKHPQSQERGITIDLGFSSFKLPSNNDVFSELGYSEVQVTLVDCPGHASLIKKIIGGAQIIDFMLLIVDINKGVQTQTAECLVIAEILKKSILVVLNKTDLIPLEKRDATISKVMKKMQNTLKDTMFHAAPIVAISACPKGSTEPPSGIDKLMDCLRNMMTPPVRHIDKPLILAVDHCFSLKGKGTILTGTVVQGRLSVNDTLEIPHLKITKKVKSIQMFKQDVPNAVAGDRVGVCVTQFESKLLERGVACEPGALQLTYAIVVKVNRVKYYKSKITSNSKYHISVGHETVIAKITLFKAQNVSEEQFDVSSHYEFVEELIEIDQETESHGFALLEFEQPIPCAEGDLVIVSRLDIDIQKPTCRISFFGPVSFVVTDKNYTETILPKLLVYKWKQKQGLIYRVVNDHEVIVHSIFKKETKMHSFTNLKVTFTSGETGVIKSTFGQGGKVKVELEEGLKEDTKARYSKKTKDSGNEVGEPSEKIRVILRFKRYIFDKNKTVTQN